MLNLLSPTGSDVLGHFESRLGLGYRDRLWPLLYEIPDTYLNCVNLQTIKKLKKKERMRKLTADSVIFPKNYPLTSSHWQLQYTPQG